MSDCRIEWVDKVPEDLRIRVEQGHARDEARKGIVCDDKRFSLIATNGEEISGLLRGYTAFTEIYVDDLWVDPKWHKRGLGRHLLHEVENHFKDQEYNNINLVTNHFQAPEFYKKCGFEVEFVRINRYNPALSKTFFIKYFENNPQTRGLLLRPR